MIKKILKLNKFGKFKDICQENNFQYGGKGHNCNIVFGFNGSGKTTISNAISLFSDNIFISEDAKAEIYSDLKHDDESHAELELQDTPRIKYPANVAHSKSIYTFNQNFVSTHVFNGTQGKLKKFSNVGGEIKNTEIEKINQQIEEFGKEKKRLEEESGQLDLKHNEVTRLRSASFGKTLTDKNKKIQIQDLQRTSLPTDSLEMLETRLNTLAADYDLSKKQSDLISDLAELKQTSFDALDIDFNAIQGVLSTNIQQLSKDVLEAKIKELQNLFSDDQHKQSVERWLRFGKETIEKVSATENRQCPICNTDIADRIDIILKDYRGYFDETYEDYINKLKIIKQHIAAITASVDKSDADASKLEKIYLKYPKQLSGEEFEMPDFSNFKTALGSLATLLASKADNIQKQFTISVHIIEQFNLLRNTLERLRRNKDVAIQTLESRKLNTNSIEDEIRKTYKEIIILEFDQSDKDGALQKHKFNTARIIEIRDKELLRLQNALAQELKKLKAESKSISKYLGKMGIDHFDIDINDANPNENIIIRFKQHGQHKTKLNNCISEGEKTALAFAYFLSKYENEVNTEEKVNNSVVVIDDPISSLDENRLYSTACLIHDNYYEVRQLIVLSHNFLFLKYFNSFYKKKVNCYFLDREKLADLPDELQNFETPYFYMLRNIMDFLDEGNNTVTYNQVKKHLPNFIRRVLETFLSFKFSTIAAKAGHRSPGLAEYIDTIDQTNFPDDVKKDVKSAIKEINHIADAHSHGNAHHTQENYYLSEGDLKRLAEKAVSIIGLMDNLHRTSFIKATATATE